MGDLVEVIRPIGDRALGLHAVALDRPLVWVARRNLQPGCLWRSAMHDLAPSCLSKNESEANAVRLNLPLPLTPPVQKNAVTHAKLGAGLRGEGLWEFDPPTPTGRCRAGFSRSGAACKVTEDYRARRSRPCSWERCGRPRSPPDYSRFGRRWRSVMVSQHHFLCPGLPRKNVSKGRPPHPKGGGSPYRGVWGANRAATRQQPGTRHFNNLRVTGQTGKKHRAATGQAGKSMSCT